MPQPAPRAPPSEELIGDIYDAALQPESWSGFLDHLSARLPDNFLLLGIIDRHPRYSVNIGMRGLPDAAIHAYRSHFIRLNPWVSALSGARLEQPVLVRALADDATVQRSEFFRDWLRHQPAQHPTSLLSPLDHHRRLCLTIVHQAGQSAEGSERTALLRTLAPHLRRAMQVSRLREVEPPRHAADAAALDMLAMGVIYTDRDGRVVMANTLAEEILRAADGLRCGADGRLNAFRPFDTEHLHDMIRAAAETAGGAAGGSGGSLSLPRAGAAGRTAVLVAPIPPAASGLVGGSARVMVFVRRGEDQARLDLPGLAGLLGVTPSEAAIAARIADGVSLDEIASSRRVTLGTVRGQVKAVLNKTGCRNQADLVRLVMRSGFGLR